MNQSTKILILTIILFVLIVIHYYMFWIVGEYFFMTLHLFCVLIGSGFCTASVDLIKELRQKENYDKKILEMVEIFS